MEETDIIEQVKSFKDAGNSKECAEDIGKDSDLDVIFNEITNNGNNDKNGSVADRTVKPKSDTPKEAVRGHFFRRHSGRGFMHRVVKMRLPKIPEGILYVKNGTYIGYHCTYCNCALKTLLSVKQHVAGVRHKETLASKKIKEGSTLGKKDTSASTSIKKARPKSSLDEYLAAATEPIVGLDHIVENVIPNKPSILECSLCKFSCNSDEMKEHISGTRHRLMYLKTVDLKRIAEMMSKNLSKSERNQQIVDHAKELEEKHGRGSILVKTKEREGISGQQRERRSDAESIQSRRSNRRARDLARGRGRRPFRGGRFGSVRRGMRGFQGGRRSLNRGGRRGNMNRGRLLKRSLPRMSSERRNQSFAKRFRGRISHSNAGTSLQPYVARGSYYGDYASCVMRMGNDPYEANPYCGNDAYYSNQYSMPREPYIEQQPYERTDRLPSQESYQRYDYGQSYEDTAAPRKYGCDSFPGRDLHSVSPNRNRYNQHKTESDDIEANPLKNLPNFDVVNEKDAGVVMNVITSLAESLLGYKMRSSVSPQEILQKLDEEKRRSANIHTDKSDARAVEKFSKVFDSLDQPSHSWNETGETRNRHSGTYESSMREWVGKGSQDSLQHKQDILHDRTPPPLRRQVDAIRDRSPSRRPMDVMRDQSPRRSLDIHSRSPPLSRRPVRDRSSPPPRRPIDMRDQSTPPPKRPMDVMRDRSSPPPKRSMDVIRDRSPPLSSRRAIDIMRNRSPTRGSMGAMQDCSPQLSRRSVDVLRNRSPPLSRGSVGVLRNRSPPPSRNHPSYVDDMFDDYQKSQGVMGSDYSTPTGNAGTPTGNMRDQCSFLTSSSYGTPASYPSPSFNTSSNFNRSNETGRLSSTGSFPESQERNVLDWKYRSLR